MVSKAEAIQAVRDYLVKKGRRYLHIDEDEVYFEPQTEIRYGRYQGKKVDVYSVTYIVEGYQYPKSYFVDVHALTGEVISTLGPHGVLEEREDWLNDTRE